jgi:Putative addiction module component
MTTSTMEPGAVERVLVEALSLPRHDRAALARELISSLESNDEAASIEAEWVAVAVERSHAYDAGETTASDWRESVAIIQAALDARTAAGVSK